MKTIRIQTKEPYDVLIGGGILKTLGARVGALPGPSRRKAALVCDDKVRALYGQAAEQSLRGQGFDEIVIDFPQGEASKDMGAVTALLDRFAAHRLGGDDVVVALGGGVAADLAGFAASLYLGGVDWVLVPTTLVAAVDSSVGGSCAVNHCGCKDLLSVTHPPALVLCDTATLETLEGELLLDGMALIVQRACARDTQLFGRLEQGLWKRDIWECIARAVELKSTVAAERSLGQVLSFGEELARGIEHLSRGKLSRGKAVSMSMCLTGEACVKHGLLDPVEAHRIRKLLDRMGLPTRAAYPVEEIYRASAAARRDVGPVQLVLLERVGKSSVRAMDAGELSSFYKVLW